MIKKFIKTAVYLVLDITDVTLITVFLRLTLIAYQNGLLIGFQYYTRVFCAAIMYLFIFVHILLLVLEHISKRRHSIWWEAISLIILFVALIATVL